MKKIFPARSSPMKKLLIALATTVALVGPAAAAPQDNLDTRDPAYRVMTVFTLNQKLRLCLNVNPDHVMSLTNNIVAKALKENPNMDTSYMWQVSQRGPYMGPPSRADCEAYYQNLVAISAGAVFK